LSAFQPAAEAVQSASATGSVRADENPKRMEGNEGKRERLQSNPMLPKQIGSCLLSKGCKEVPLGKESIPPDLPT